jgi:hypothetical protein
MVITKPNSFEVHARSTRPRSRRPLCVAVMADLWRTKAQTHPRKKSKSEISIRLMPTPPANHRGAVCQVANPARQSLGQTRFVS